MKHLLISTAATVLVATSASVYINSGMTREQAKHYENLLRTDPKAAHAYRNRIFDDEQRQATAAAKARDEERRQKIAEFRQRLQALDDSYKDRVKDAMDYYRRGRLIQRAISVHGDRLMALPDFSEAIELDAKCAPAYLRRGQILITDGSNGESGFRDILTAVKLDPDKESFHAYAALAHLDRRFKLGDLTAALDHAKKAVALGNDKNPDTLQVLANAYAAKGDFPKAIELQSEAKRLMQNANRPWDFVNEVRLTQYDRKVRISFSVDEFDRLTGYGE